jgi:protein tyrosine phosphatase (PTP) superfamily phosphohydrolase (DUF442 family)
MAPVPTTAPCPGGLPPGVPPARVEGPAQASFVPSPPPAATPAPPADTPTPATPDGEAPYTPPSTRREAARPPTPDSKEPPAASVPGEPAPRAEEERNDSTNIDLPGFQVVRPGLATGLRPYPDGVNWLKSHGYRTVLHLRQPGEDSAAQKRLFENKGLTYLSLEASPARLTRELYEEFVKLVEERANRPLFVYDKDGAAAGGLWWLYFRVHLSYTDEKARAEAKRLGLQMDEFAPEEHKTMILAVQNLLKKLKR